MGKRLTRCPWPAGEDDQTMTRYGYFLSSEEYPPEELVRQARLAEEAGFDGL